MLLVVADLAFADSRWCKGAIIGVATGLKLTPGLFIVYLLLTKRFRAAAVATTSFLATAAAGFAILPKQAIEFWSPHSLMSLSSRIGTAYVENQSFNGFFSRISATDAGSRPGWIISAAIGGIACMVIAVKAHQYCGEMGGMLVAAAATLLISPISWTHYWVWVIPAIAWLAYSIWTTDQGRRWKIPCLAGAYAIFLAYPLRIGHPGTWDPNLKLLPWGVIWLAPNDEGRERAWNQWWQPALGNLYIVIALIVLAATAVWLVRKRQPTISLPEPATPEPATPRTEEVAASEPESATSLTRIGPKPVD
jgi:alpha-1,2-mannosyltransferase